VLIPPPAIAACTDIADSNATDREIARNRLAAMNRYAPFPAAPRSGVLRTAAPKPARPRGFETLHRNMEIALHPNTEHQI
jgi:hypothetical protein